MSNLSDLFAAIYAAVAESWPGRVPVRVVIYLHDGQDPISLPVPPLQRPHDDPEAVFIPNAFQEAILAALEGKALKTDALGAAVGDRSRLFRKPKGGLPELREQDLVRHHPRLGFFRPDAPPEELATE